MSEAKEGWRPGIGMPAALLLDEFGLLVADAFGGLQNVPYHVGSSLVGKVWRDVDVRLILSDEEYAALGLGDPEKPHSERRWVALVRAFSALGREMTGLPIDFQIQQASDAQKKFSREHVSSALGVNAQFRRQGNRG